MATNLEIRLAKLEAALRNRRLAGRMRGPTSCAFITREAAEEVYARIMLGSDHEPTGAFDGLDLMNAAKVYLQMVKGGNS